jgi:hypothetical protein
MVVEAQLWFNRMPGGVPELEPQQDSPVSPPGENRVEPQQGPLLTPLSGSISLRGADSPAVQPPSGVALQGAWLRAGDSIWALSTAPVARGDDGIPLRTHLVGGAPVWLQGDDTVDVVIRVRYPDGSSRLVQKPRVRVYVAY